MAKPFVPRGRGYRGREEKVRKNERIRAREVRLIGTDGKQVGVVARDEAIQAARRVGLDLVEISPNANPPVCRILDFGKYMYELSKRQKENKARSSTSSKVKEVKFRVRTEEHDYMTKMRHGEEFLYKGYKLKLSLQFRGRENEHKELGVEVVRRAAADLLHVGLADSDAKLSGRHVSCIMSPLPAAKRRLKFNEKLEPGEPEHDEADDVDETDEADEADD
jgi:translation initiation factor IF-3